MNVEDCFDQILKFYRDIKDKEQFGEINQEKWLLNSKYLVKLMKHLDKSVDNYERVKNCLLFLMNLCFDIDQPDHYHTKGKSPKELSEQEKQNYKGLLKTECSTLIN